MDAALLQLQKAASQLQVRLPSGALELFERYLSELLRWRTRLSLIGAASPRDIVERHFIDSLFLLAQVDVPIGARIVDVGTGAGFPGVPVRIVRPDLRMTLVEAVRRKVAFLEHLRNELGFTDLEIKWERAEKLGHLEGERETFDLAVTRATARMAVAAEMCLPLVMVGGAAVCLKGPRVQEELAAARALIRELGAHVEACKLQTLPTTDLQRAAAIFRKDRSTPERFPRPARSLGKGL